ncbi:MAG: Ig-like domain-containing protein, partial [Lachnospiraceae bacterium]|nr:Ig-like domain-containing protein [Lachnospiraceae bacterium]
TLRGIGEYGGTKTYSFKINKKKYQINRVKGIRLDKTSLTFSLAEPDTKKRTLTATITSESDENITNPTVIWTSSNSDIVAIEEKPDGDVTGSADGKQTISTSVVLTLKKEGSVTITAASQDGNKKTQCKITVIDAPVLLEADQTIKENIGSTYQLHMEFAPTQDKSKLKWESNNSDAVSVDQDGLLTMKKAGAAIITAVYTSSSGKFTQQCYAVAIGENEAPPEPETGALLTYKQQEGVTDDTPYINKMLRDFEWGDDTHEREVTLYLPAGVYHIDATADGKDLFGKDKFGGIVLTTNQKLVMSPSALLIALPNSKGNYQVINISGRDGVSVSGGQIIGERKEHKGSGGEWGHGIAVFGSTNVTIENVDISQCWGDGIYLGLYNGWDDSGNKKQFLSNGVTITNCNLHHNRRNNLSITDVSNVTVKNCKFNNANGTAPQYGIDIEPNSGNTCSNVTISDSTFHGNAGGTIQILGQLNAHVKGVTIENCTGDKAPVIWEGFGGSVSGVTQNGNKW